MPVLPLGLVKTRHMVSQVGLNLFGAMTVFGVSRLVAPLIHTYPTLYLRRHCTPSQSTSSPSSSLRLSSPRAAFSTRL